jgi:hypothetical protein
VAHPAILRKEGGEPATHSPPSSKKPGAVAV